MDTLILFLGTDRSSRPKKKKKNQMKIQNTYTLQVKNSSYYIQSRTLYPTNGTFKTTTTKKIPKRDRDYSCK